MICQKKGTKVSLSKVQKGDLLFFKTNKKKRTINHVGLVVEKNKKGLLFIHSTTSSGVIISSLDENYLEKSLYRSPKSYLSSNQKISYIYNTPQLV